MAKSKFSGLFLPLIDTFLTIFNERRAPIVRKYVAKQGIVIPPKLIKNNSNLTLRYSIFALERQAKNPIFQILFISITTFVGYC